MDKVLGTVAPKTWDFKTSYDNMNAGFKAGTTMCIMQGPWQVADILKGTAFTDRPTSSFPDPDGVQARPARPSAAITGSSASTSARTPTRRPPWPASSPI